MGGIHKCVTTICLLANLFHRSGTKEHPRFIHSRQGFEDEEIYRDGISGSDSGRKIQG
jgi:hypothetical protein